MADRRFAPDVGYQGGMPMKNAARLLLVSACLLAQPVIDSQDEWRFDTTFSGEASPGKDTGTKSKVRVRTLLQITFKGSDGKLGRQMYQAGCDTSFGRFSLRGKGLKGTHHGQQIVSIVVKAAQCCSPLRQDLCPPLEPERVPSIACQ